MRIAPMIALFATLAACESTASDPVGGTVDLDREWRLTQLNGAPFTASATLTFSEGNIGGSAPCNGYGGDLNSTYPQFDAGPIISTKIACAELDAENAYFQALEAASAMNVQGDTLTLSTAAGPVLVFSAVD